MQSDSEKYYNYLKGIFEEKAERYYILSTGEVFPANRVLINKAHQQSHENGENSKKDLNIQTLGLNCIWDGYNFYDRSGIPLLNIPCHYSGFDPRTGSAEFSYNGLTYNFNFYRISPADIENYDDEMQKRLSKLKYENIHDYVSCGEISEGINTSKKILYDFNAEDKIINNIVHIIRNGKEELHLIYNDSFLYIICKTSEKHYQRWVLTKHQVIIDNDTFEEKFADDVFNKERDDFDENYLVIRTSKFIRYYDKNGQVVSEFRIINKEENHILIDKSMFILYNKHIITDLKMVNEKFQFRLNDKIYYCRYTDEIAFNMNRLLIQDENGLYGYLDSDGNIVIKPCYTQASDFKFNGIAEVAKEENGKLRVLKIDANGTEITDSLVEKIYEENLKPYRGKFNNVKSLDIKELAKDRYYYETFDSNYQLVYTYFDFKNNAYINTRFEPLRQYENYLICSIFNDSEYKNGIYALDLRTRELEFLSEFDDNEKLFFDSYFIVGLTTYYPTEELINLGDFCLQNRKLKSDTKIYGKEEFLAAIKTKEEMLNDSYNLKRKIRYEISLLDTVKVEEQAEINRARARLRKLRREAELLKIYGKIPVPDDFFLESNDKKLINPEYVKDLKYFDLMFENFDNCVVSGIDFNGSNASIDPHRVYNRDMSNGDYRGIYILNHFDLSDVILDNSLFDDEWVLMAKNRALSLKKQNS